MFQFFRARPHRENKFLYLLREYFYDNVVSKVIVSGYVTLCSVVVTDISVLEEHVVEVTLQIEGTHSLETIMSALLRDVVPED
jgi:hypothetical protein